MNKKAKIRLGVVIGFIFIYLFWLGYLSGEVEAIIEGGAPVTDSQGNYVLVTDNANYTINKTNAWLQQITLTDSKNMGLQILNTTSGKISGIQYYNGTTHRGTAFDPIVNTLVNWSINNSRHIVAEINDTKANFNLTIEYFVSDNNKSLIINATLKRLSLMENNATKFRYFLYFNQEYLDNMNVTPQIDSKLGTIASGINDLNMNKDGQDIGAPSSWYIFNNSFGLLFNVEYPLSNFASGSVGGGDSNENTNFRLRRSAGIPLQYATSFIYFEKPLDSFSVYLSLTANPSLERAKRDAYNTTYKVNYSLMGSWMNLCGSVATITDSQLQDAYDNGVRFVELNCWGDDTGLYYLDDNDNNWKSENVGVMNRTWMNNLINRILSKGMQPYLYFFVSSLNSTTATRYFNSSIVVNNTYDKQFLSDDKLGYRMAFDNRSDWFLNSTDQLDFLLTNYPNVSGIFLDVNYVRDVDFNNTNSPFWANIPNISYSSVPTDYIDFLANISKRIHNVHNKSLILNNVQSINYVQYADGISEDSDATSRIENLKMISLGKPFYFLALTQNFTNYFNESVKWGVYPEYDEYKRVNYTPSQFFLINFTATKEMIRFYNNNSFDQYVLFDQAITSYHYINYTDIDNNNYDYYLVNNHTLLKQDTNNIEFNATSNLTSIIWYGHFGSYKISENYNNATATAENTTGYIFDTLVPVWFSSATSTLKKISSNLTQDINATVVFNVTSCQIERFEYKSNTSKYQQTYYLSAGNARCNGNIVTIDNVSIEPANESNTFSIIYLSSGGGGGGGGSGITNQSNQTQSQINNQSNQQDNNLTDYFKGIGEKLNPALSDVEKIVIGILVALFAIMVILHIFRSREQD